jgi:hypothetical protein
LFLPASVRSLRSPFFTRVTGNGADPSIALDSAATRRLVLLA